MLSRISWTSFIWIVIPIILTYYLYVLIVYFRKEIFSASADRKIMINRDTKSKDQLNTRSISEIQPNSKSVEAVESDDNPFTLIHELLEDLKILFNKSEKENTVKEELIQAVRSKLKEYPGISEKEIREDINEHISMEAREKCGIDLTPEDIKIIWAT